MRLTLVFSLLATTLLAVNADEIQSGMILGGANTEFGVGSHTFYVMYPGIQNAGGSATFEIMKTDENLTTFDTIHTYNVEQGKEDTPYTHFFAIKDKTDDMKYYSIKFCNNENQCSKPSSPPTWIDNGKATLDCKEVSQDVKDINIPAVEAYATGQELEGYKTQISTSTAAKESIQTVPSYKKKTEAEGFIYFLINYPLYEFKELFQVASDTNGYCKRKYTFMILTLLVDKNTKMVSRRGRFTPASLPNDKIETYITGQNPQKVPIEFKLDVKVEEAQRSNSEIWQTVCMSAKDKVGTREEGFSAKCSEPFIQDWDETLVNAQAD